MVFSSAIFLFLFLPLTLAGYYLIRPDFRNLFLLLASLFFYAWGETVYVLIMLVSMAMNYVFGLAIDYRKRRENGKIPAGLILAAGVSANLLLLLYFKYANFFVENINFLLQNVTIQSLTLAPVHLPIGISFFTFQAMSYLIDIYRAEASVQRNATNCALYIALFPQLIAGPIVRYHDVAKQLLSRTTNIQRFSSGIQRFIFGLAKKVILANPLGEVADQIFALPVADVTSGMAWLGIACYSLQIYFDFSGYSDMAIGLGRMFGFEFLENFNYPYISKSIREFWRRWHISLSSWFRDYLYIPLGGNRGSQLRTYLNLWIVFLLCGFWHGASWNFLIWGALHGGYLVIERLGFGKNLQRLWPPLQYAYTLLLVIIAWVFFRAETLAQSAGYLKAMFGFGSAGGIEYYTLMYCDLKTVSLLLIGILLATPIFRGIGQRFDTFRQQSPSFLLNGAIAFGHYIILIGLFFLSATHLAAGTYNPFIYFRF